MQRKIGIIGGSGVEDPELMRGFKQEIIYTPYGYAICNIGEMFGNNVVFVSRHGADHSVMPSNINYRANIWALRHFGTREILATTAVGSLNKDMRPGDFVICSNILDFTKNRISTFYDTPDKGVIHVNFTYPYCDYLRQLVKESVASLGFTYHDSGIYVCTEGPRFETAAEIKMFAMLGGDVVGMTQMPEAVLAREAGMCYANLSVVTNMGAGIVKEVLNHAQVVASMDASKEKLQLILKKFISLPGAEHECDSQQALVYFNGDKL